MISREICETDQSCVASIFKTERHKTDRCSYYTGQLFVSAGKGIWSGASIAFKSAYLTVRLLFSPHEHQTHANINECLLGKQAISLANKRLRAVRKYT